MTAADIFHETYTALSANKVRSGLTILGIVIGISSVIAMISIGQGAQATIKNSIQSIGSNLVIVSPGAQRGPGVAVSAGRGSAKSLKLSDVDAIEKQVQNINAVSPEVTGRYQVTARGTNTNTSVIGTTPEYLPVRNVEVDTGSFISDQNISGLSKVAVLGPTTRDDLFGEDGDAVGQMVRIKNVDFRVIGITKAKGGSGFSNPDDAIYIPISTAQRFLSGDEYVSTISISAANADVTAQVQQDVTGVLLAAHHISDATLADFSTLNQADIIATASSVTQIFTILLGSVAGISLIVGGIGIMNMMLTTVTERTRKSDCVKR
jgi:putative ABC transport system permease protein